MYKILVVEDDTNIQDILAYNLEKVGYKVFTADTGIEALDIIKEEEDISLVLMDVMLSGMDGYQCTEKIREFTSIPILILTALEEENKVLKGFSCGANDYITKPFRVKEVLARVQAQLKFSEAYKTIQKSSPIVNIKDLVVHTDKNSVSRGNKDLGLSTMEYNLLLFLNKNPNTVFDRQSLLKEVWGSQENNLSDNRSIDGRLVDVAIKRLRNKIEKDPSNPEIIMTRRGQGYYLSA